MGKNVGPVTKRGRMNIPANPARAKLTLKKATCRMFGTVTRSVDGVYRIYNHMSKLVFLGTLGTMLPDSKNGVYFLRQDALPTLNLSFEVKTSV